MHIGYCPQQDTLFDLLTVEEHLYFFAKLRGIDSETRKEIINDQINELALKDFRNKLVGKLSGGNKRKL